LTEKIYRAIVLSGFSENCEFMPETAKWQYVEKMELQETKICQINFKVCISLQDIAFDKMNVEYTKL